MGLSLTPAESWLVHTAIGGGLMLLLALVLMRMVRQPVRRQRLGEWGLAAALLVAVLALGPSWLTLSWSAEDATPKAGEFETLVMAEPVEGEMPSDPIPALHGAGSPAAAAEPTGPGLLEALGPWLLWVFSIGAALFLGHWLLGYVILARILRDARTVPHSIASLFEQMRGHKASARLLVSSRLPVPVSCGILRPTIVLPAALCEPPDVDKLRWVFAHELTHLERRDAWSTVLFGLGQTIYFYLPWFWALRRQVRLCQEYIADAAAIQAIGGVDVPTETAADYAEFLLSLTNSPAVPVVATGISGNTSDLFRRVSMLLQNPLRIERRCSQIWSLVTGAVLLGAAIVLGGIGLQVEAAPADDAAEQTKDITIKVPVRYLLSSEGEGKGFKVVVLDQKDPAQGDIIIRKEPGDAKKIIIHRNWAGGDGQKYVAAFAAGDGQLEPLRKALEKLEKSGTVNAEQIRQEVMKALEAIKAAPAKTKTSSQRIEIRLHVDPETRKVYSIQTAPTPPTAPKISPPPMAKPQTVERTITIPVPTAAAPQIVERKVTVSAPHLDVDAIRKAVEKALKGVEKAENADDLAKAIEKALQGVKEKKAPSPTWYRTLAVPAPAAGAGGAAKIDIQVIKKLVEQLEQTPGNTKVLRELLNALLGSHGGQAAVISDVFKQASQRPIAFSNSPYQVVFSGGTSGQGRLGVVVDTPSALLADQLNLPMGQGLVITEVKADSPAAKAGLKANDILLELHKQTGLSKPGSVAKILADLKGGTVIDAVVLRKGKRETITGITIAERPMQPPASGFGSGTSGSTTRSTAVQAMGALGSLVGKPGAGSVSTTTIRTGDRFTTRYQEGSLIISVVGNVTGGKAKAQEISIQDGSVTNKYETVEAVPAQYRDKVNYVLDVSSKGEFRTESKK